MFKKSKDGRIESDEGFSVKVIGRAGLEYKEGIKLIYVDSEMLGNSKIGFAIASSSIDRWQGSKQKIGAKEKLKILNNIKEAFRFLGYEIKVIRDF